MHEQALAACIPVLMALDEAYHWLYYMQQPTKQHAKNADVPALPAPHVYFTSRWTGQDWLKWIPGCAAMLRLGLPGAHPAELQCLTQEPTAAISRSNPLLALLVQRQRETAAFFGQRSNTIEALQPSGMGSVPDERATMKRTDPVCEPLLALWRNSVRTWACRVFAYAVPSEPALAALARQAPLVEWGAGCGYWAHLLSGRGVDILALDCAPPDSAANEYHGRCATWCTVRQGALSQHMLGRTLFLCYPPPDTQMALQALQAYSGSTMCYVGEWSGDTGTAEFQAELLRKWRLTERIALPNWGDTVYELMIWQRCGTSGSHATELPPDMQCTVCASPGSRDKPLRCCRRTVAHAFCSQACLEHAFACCRHASSAQPATDSSNCYVCDLQRRTCTVMAGEVHLSDDRLFSFLPTVLPTTSRKRKKR